MINKIEVVKQTIYSVNSCMKTAHSQLCLRNASGMLRSQDTLLVSTPMANYTESKARRDYNWPNWV